MTTKSRTIIGNKISDTWAVSVDTEANQVGEIFSFGEFNKSNKFVVCGYSLWDGGKQEVTGTFMLSNKTMNIKTVDVDFLHEAHSESVKANVIQSYDNIRTALSGAKQFAKETINS